MILKNKLYLASFGLVLTLSSPLLHAQDDSSSPSIDEDSALAAAPQPQTLENKPPSPPQVTCKDGLLKIDASNSTLKAVLDAVSACTDIKMEVPETAASERLFATLGPGPARQILASLLSSTDLNYLIQSAESDPQKVQTVMLMARTTHDSGASAVANMPPARRGWMQTRRTTVESTVSQADESTPVTNTVETATASLAEASSAEVVTPAPEPPTTTDAAVPVETAAVRNETPATVPESNASPIRSNTTQDLIQNMRRMFEERRKLQQQEKVISK